MEWSILTRASDNRTNTFDAVIKEIREAADRGAQNITGTWGLDAPENADCLEQLRSNECRYHYSDELEAISWKVKEPDTKQ